MQKVLITVFALIFTLKNFVFISKFIYEEKPELLRVKLTFNITYYSAFQNVRSILQELQILLAHHKEHKNVFSEVPAVGFGNGKSLKDYLLRAALPKMDNAGGSELCGKGT